MNQQRARRAAYLASHPRERRRSEKRSDLRLYWRVMREGRRYWGHVAFLFVLSLGAMPMALLGPFPLKIAVDSALGSHPLPGFVAFFAPGVAERSTTGVLVVAVVMLVVVGLLSQLQQFATTVVGTFTGERLQLQFRTKLFRHVQQLSLAHHDTSGTADASYRIQYDSETIKDVVVSGFTPFATSLVVLGGMIVVTARIDWQLAMLALTMAPLLFLIARQFRLPLKGGWREAKQMESSSIAVIQEVLTSLRVVKAFGQEEREAGRFVDRATLGMRARIRLAVLQGASTMLFGLASSAGTAAVLFIGIRHVQNGRLTLGNLLLIMGYLSQLYAPLTMISNSLMKLQSSLASAERAYAVLDAEPDVPEPRHPIRIKRATGRVEFRDVSFAYGSGPPVLNAISFEVAPGTRVGISGATGAGKTTLVSLLSRFYDPTHGSILLDGYDVRDYKLADLRNQFGIVLQEPVLFSTTVAENVAYARPDAHMSEIVAAARAANAHEFIDQLPDGYFTVVGERGMKLSGGERQRISLARAFLKDAPILVLDEPTSSVDYATEALIMDAMGRLMEGRTAFMIAHRVETLQHCDVRLALDRGRLMERAPVEPLERAAQPTP